MELRLLLKTLALCLLFDLINMHCLSHARLILFHLSAHQIIAGHGQL